MTKAGLRKFYMEKRGSLSPAEAASMSAAIAGLFFRTIDPLSITALHTFIRARRLNEVDTSNIYYKLWKSHPWVRTFAPRMDRENVRLANVEFSPATELVEDKWGIREPVGKDTDAELMDVVVVPLVCFDRTGHRVGYGKGYYDEFLRRCRPDCVKAGVSFFPPVEGIDDLHEMDVPLDVCITPGEVYNFRPADHPVN
jgi:5-formyltetrahydrofolate cyclo-ligase